MAINYVVDSNFRPYSFEERIKPYLLYKEAYDKADAAADELRKKASKFAYLAEVTEDDAPAKAIYEGYARDLKAQADDFSKHGLTASNSRALRNLRSRYYDEIGQLERADEMLQAEKDLRKAAREKGQHMLYADNDLRISSYLGNKTPNVYGINEDDLRKEGALYAQNVSSGIYSDPMIKDINKYYQDISQTQGLSPKVVQAWRDSLVSIPSFDRAVEDVLKARGVTDNLTGADYERARQSVINGIMEGSIYKENRDIKQNPGVLTAEQQASNALGWANHNESVRQHNLQMQMAGYDPETGEYDPDKDQSVKKAKAIADAKNTGNGGGGRGASYDMQNTETIMVGSSSGSFYKKTGDDTMDGKSLESIEGARTLTPQERTSLVDEYGNIANEQLREIIGNGDINDYVIKIVPKGSTQIDGSGFWSDDTLDEDVYIVIPRKSKRASTEQSTSVGGTNDIPE